MVRAHGGETESLDEWFVQFFYNDEASFERAMNKLNEFDFFREQWEVQPEVGAVPPEPVEAQPKPAGRKGKRSQRTFYIRWKLPAEFLKWNGEFRQSSGHGWRSIDFLIKPVLKKHSIMSRMVAHETLRPLQWWCYCFFDADKPERYEQAMSELRADAEFQQQWEVISEDEFNRPIAKAENRLPKLVYRSRMLKNGQQAGFRD